jgi:hypothetical protein
MVKEEQYSHSDTWPCCAHEHHCTQENILSTLTALLYTFKQRLVNFMTNIAVVTIKRKATRRSIVSQSLRLVKSKV